MKKQYYEITRDQRSGSRARVSRRGRAVAAAIEAMEPRLLLTTVVTDAPSNISTTSATLNATVNPQGATTTALFQFSTDPTFKPTVSSTLSTSVLDPVGVAVDASDNAYVSSGSTGVITEFLANNTTKTVFTVSDLTAAGLAVDAAGDVFVADSLAGTIIKVSVAGTSQIIASGFNDPQGVAVDAAGDIFVADTGHNAVTEILPGGTMQPVGSGFNTPSGVAVDAAGNVFVADSGNNAIQEVAAGTGLINHVGSGFSFPTAVAVDTLGDVFATDFGSRGLSEVEPNGQIRTLGSGFDVPDGVAVSAIGNVIVADPGTSNNPKLSAVSPAVGAASPFMPTGSNPVSITASVAGLSAGTLIYYRAVALSSTGGAILGATQSFVTAPAPVATTGQTISITTSSATLLGTINAQGVVSTPAFQVSSDPALTPTVLSTVDSQNAPSFLAMDPAGNIYTTQINTSIITEFFVDGTQNSVAPPNLGTPSDLAVDAGGNIFTTDFADGLVQELPKNGSALTLTSAISDPNGIAVDAAGNLFVTDPQNNAVDEILPNGLMHTVGSGFNFPSGITVDSSGDVFVADFGNNAIKEILPDGTINTIGSGIVSPESVAVDNAGDVFVTEEAGSSIKEILPDGTILNVGPGIKAGGAGGGIAVNAAGDITFADIADSQILKLSPSQFDPSPATVSGSSNTGVSAMLSNLAPGTYTYRAIATSANGIGVGSTAAFFISPAGTTATTIALTTSADASGDSTFQGAPITLTAAVSPTPGGSGPTGSVTFFDGSAQLGPAVVFASDGSASLTIPSLAAGNNVITASYNGDATFAASTSSPTTVSVSAVPPTTVTAPDITVNTAAETITVVYSSNLPIVTTGTAINANNIAVTGPSNQALTVTSATFVASNNGMVVTATYIVAAPGTGGTWPAGTYTVAAGSSPVTDSLFTPLVIPTQTFASALAVQDLSASLTSTITSTIPTTAVGGVAFKAKATLTLTPGTGAATGLAAGATVVLSPDESSADAILTLGSTKGKLNFKKGKPVRANINFNQKISTTAPAGVYHVLIRLTDTNGNIETYETGQTVTIAAAAVDLTGSFVKVPTSAKNGKTFPITILITNTTAANIAAVGPLGITVDSSPDGTLGNFFAFKKNKINLKPGKSMKVTLTGKITTADKLIVDLDILDTAFPDDVNRANNAFVTPTQIAVV